MVNQGNDKGNNLEGGCVFFITAIEKINCYFQYMVRLPIFVLSVQDKQNPAVKDDFISDLPQSVIKSQSRTVWSYLWEEGGQGNFETVTYHELQLSLFPCQLLSGSETCSKGEI